MFRPPISSVPALQRHRGAHTRPMAYSKELDYLLACYLLLLSLSPALFASVAGSGAMPSVKQKANLHAIVPHKTACHGKSSFSLVSSHPPKSFEPLIYFKHASKLSSLPRRNTCLAILFPVHRQTTRPFAPLFFFSSRLAHPSSVASPLRAPEEHQTYPYSVLVLSTQ
ncbi:hypothetical protein IF1G_05564 [Cordyceps javanica]|uniref:Uncharacterized protein n=1 Tax=Cordyceps javanica TaxID=43265 RepID=A0A545V1Y4_9HYPO|nr:hypothetical protein IF1G_05564 [Cordyceps javanica]